MMVSRWRSVMFCLDWGVASMFSTSFVEVFGEPSCLPPTGEAEALLCGVGPDGGDGVEGRGADTEEVERVVGRVVKGLALAGS